ncbi:hypothetical protein ACQP10_34800 [Streptosporangium sandarakinum]|uniref:hypothetical protein n=1 Tax=Streptosporangium sandarakinum TaxID=1260955 RepID=UPI003D8ECBF8
MNEHPSREYQVLLSVDVENYGGRNYVEHRTLQSALVQVVDEAADRAELDRHLWVRQMVGDSITALLPGGTDVYRILDNFVRELDAAIGFHNRRRAEPAWSPMRLRLALDAGLVDSTGAAGWPGPRAVEVVRLRDSRPARAALGVFPAAELVVIVSEAIYNDHVTQLSGRPAPSEFLRVHTEEKTERYTAYLYVPRFDPHSSPELVKFAVESDPHTSDTSAPPGERAPSGPAETPHIPTIHAGRDAIGQLSNHVTNGDINSAGRDQRISSRRMGGPKK